MNNSHYKCQFCQTVNPITSYVSKCRICNIEHFLVHNKLSAITYNLCDDLYDQMIISFHHIYTTIWFQIETNMKIIVIPQVFHNVHPKDALALAKRLHNLTAFL